MIAFRCVGSWSIWCIGRLFIAGHSPPGRCAAGCMMVCRLIARWCTSGSRISRVCCTGGCRKAGLFGPGRFFFVKRSRRSHGQSSDSPSNPSNKPIDCASNIGADRRQKSHLTVLLFNCLVKPVPCVFFPFTIYNRNEDSKYAQQAIGQVLFPCGFPCLGPFQPLLDCEFRERFPSERGNGDSGPFLYELFKKSLVAQACTF